MGFRACICIIAPVALWPHAAHCQSSEELKWLVDTMARLCVSGGDQISVRATGSEGADLMLRSQNTSGKLEGEFYIDRSRSEGLVGGISNAITSLQAQQATEVRRCLEPLRVRLLEISIPHDINRPRRAGDPLRATSSNEQEGLRLIPPLQAPPDNPHPAPTDHQTESVAFRFSPNVINESSEGFSCRKAAMPMDYVICVFQKVYDINTQHAAAC